MKSKVIQPPILKSSNALTVSRKEQMCHIAYINILFSEKHSQLLLALYSIGSLHFNTEAMTTVKNWHTQNNCPRNETVWHSICNFGCITITNLSIFNIFRPILIKQLSDMLVGMFWQKRKKNYPRILVLCNIRQNVFFHIRIKGKR